MPPAVVSRPPSPVARVARIVLSAGRSTVVVIVVSLAVSAIYHGGFDRRQLWYVLVANRELFGLIFLALCAWDGWMRRPKRKLVTD